MRTGRSTGFARLAANHDVRVLRPDDIELPSASIGVGGGCGGSRPLTRSPLRCRVRRAVGVAACSLVVFAVGCIAPPLASAAWSWSSLEPVDPSTNLSDVSCPSVSLCVAVDIHGNVLSSTNPTGGASSWATVHVTNGGLSGISCPSVTLCVAVGSLGTVFTSTDPAGGASTWTAASIDGYNTLYAVSCPSVSLCVAVDSAGNVFTSGDPTGGVSAWTLARAGPASGIPPVSCFPAFVCTVADPLQLLGVSCPSVSLCVATVADGDLLTSTDPTGGTSAWATTHLAPPSAGFILTAPQCTPGLACYVTTGVSCPSVSLCVVGTSTGNFLTSTDPAGGVSAWKTNDSVLVGTVSIGPLRVDAVSCASTSACVAVSEDGYVASSTDPTAGPSAWATTSLHDVWELTGISCPSPSLCVAVDWDGRVAVGQGQLTSTSAALDAQLVLSGTTPTGGHPTIATLLEHKSYVASVIAQTGGTALINWYYLPKGAHLAQATTKPKPVLVATDNALLKPNLSTRVTIRLTPAGIRLLSHAKRVTLTAEDSFTAVDGVTATVKRTFTLDTLVATRQPIAVRYTVGRNGPMRSAVDPAWPPSPAPTLLRSTSMTMIPTVPLPRKAALWEAARVAAGMARRVSRKRGFRLAGFKRILR